MTHSNSARLSELHHIAAHAHAAAAASLRKNDPSAQDLCRRAHEYSTRAFEASREAAEDPGIARVKQRAS
jgi:hypothetical protein